MNRLYDSINTACADSGIGDQAVSKIADALDKAIRGTTDEDQGTGQTGMRGGSTFASYLTSSSRFFTLKLAGQAGDTTVRIKAVLDVENQDPKNGRSCTGGSISDINQFDMTVRLCYSRREIKGG